MKRTSLLAALCMIGLLMLPRIASAQMVALSDDQLSEITGQAGFAFDQHYDNMSAMNGIFNLSDVTIKGSIDSRGTSTLNSGLINQMATPGFGMMGLGLMGLNSMGIGTHVIDMTINIDQFSIGAIRIGSDTTGPSLGSLDIFGMHAEIKGTVAITPR